MKTTRILYWIFTGLIVAFDGVMPALTFNTNVAKEGISHLGYPDYFRVVLTVFKVAGAIILILPLFKGRIKEWAYAGFSFNFIFATISLLIVNGVKGQSFFPLIAFAILMVSYYCYIKLLPTLKSV